MVFSENTLKMVLHAIPTGKENAIHLEELSQRLDMHPQAIKECIKELRRQYGAVFSGSNGYWTSDSQEECENFIRMMKRQAISRLKSIRLMEQNVRKSKAQLCLPIDQVQVKDGE